MSGIFGTFAPIYTAMGLEPRPVPLGKKGPSLKGWQKPDTLIDPEERKAWLTKHRDLGIGLRTGSMLPDGTRLGVLDIDRDDLVRVARLMLGPTAERVGSKGTALFFRYAGQLKRKSLRRQLPNGDEQAVGDLLVDSAFCMIPPSIHPSTERAYQWVGQPLEDRDLASLPLVGLLSDLGVAAEPTARSLELMLAVLQSPQLLALAAEGAGTHDAALAFVNVVLPHCQDVEFITALVAAALPEGYRGNTLGEVPELVASGIAKGFHQPRGYDRAIYDPGDEGPIPFGYLPNGDFVLFDQRKRIIVPISSNGLVTPATLMSFAPLTFWASRFPKEGGVNTYAAADAVIAACIARGGFDPGGVRGRGVFPDPRGGYVVNWGGEVPKDTSYVYVCYRALDLSLTDKEVDPHAVLHFLERFNWSDPSSAMLLLGWAASSIICGALRWRPHVFVTGAKNTGKTTLIKALTRLLDPVAIVLDGQSSEAGIRQKVGPDSRPVILDEFESDQNTMRMRQVIKLMRSASSSESTVARGTPEGKALEFVIRSSFLLAAINPMGVTAADRSRIVVLTLGKHDNDRETAGEIARELEALQGVGPSWCTLLLGRVDRILANIATLERVFPACDSRHAVNMATLLGAAQAVLLDHPLGEDEARALLNDHRGLIDHLAEAHDEDDSVNCWNALLEFTVRTDESSEMLGSLLARIKAAEAAGRIGEDAKRLAERVLARFGIKCEAGGVLVANSHRGLETVFEGTAWEAGTWGPSLKRLEGARPTKQRRFGEKRSEGTWIPMSWVPEQVPGNPEY